MTKVTVFAGRWHLKCTAMRQCAPFLTLLMAWLFGLVATCVSADAARVDSKWIVINLHHPRGDQSSGGKVSARQCEWSADHKLVALSYIDGCIGFIDPLTKSKKFVKGALRNESEDTLKWRPDGMLLSFGDSDPKIINPKTAKVTTLKSLGYAASMDVSPDCKLAITRGYGYEPIEVMEVASANRIFFDGPKAMMPKGTYASQISEWSPDSKTFIATRGKSLHLYEPKSTKPLSSYVCPSDFHFEYATWMPDGKLFVSGYQDRKMVMLKFEASGGHLVFKERIVIPSDLPTDKQHGISHSQVLVALDAGGKSVTVATQDAENDKLYFWNSASNRKIIAADDHEPIFNATPYLSADGHYLALAHFNSGIVSLFDTRSGKILVKLYQKGEGDEANVAVHWSEDSRAFAVVGDTGSLQVGYLAN